MPFGSELNVLVGLVLSAGPLLLLGLAFAETAAVTGLFVPAGLALSFASFLATLGLMPLPAVVIAAGVGAVLGDQAGYWIGRRGEARLHGRGGRLGELLRRTERRSSPFFSGYPIVAVSLARVVSFVRTLMPPVAGMSGMSWARFTIFDLAGIGLWLALYVSVGTLAGVSWEPVTRAMGAGSLGVFLLVVLALYVAHRLARRRSARKAVGGTDDLDQAASDRSG